MRLTIRHTTRYKFAEAVGYGIQRLRLTPKETQGQRVLEWKMVYENAREELVYDDQNFNHVTVITVDEGAREVVVGCVGTVETQDQAGVIGHHAGHLPLWSFLSHTELTRPGPKIRQILAGVERSEDGMVSTLHNLSAAILEAVEYVPGETDAATSAEAAAAAGRGVCQDHAHIFIAAARAIDVPARYVSGYLMMDDRVEQEATHAWAEAFVPSLGWVGFDVSNGISPDPRYVRVATGRDYRDAAPVTGVSFGGVTQDLQVELEVEQRSAEQ